MLLRKHIPLFIINMISFLAVTSLLVSSFTGQATLSSRFRWGGALYPLSGNFSRMSGMEQCNGVWDCLRALCTMRDQKNVTYVAVRDFYLGERANTSCSYDMNQALDIPIQYSAFQACVAFLVLALIFETTAAFNVFLIQRKLIPILNYILSTLFITVSWSCYGFYLLKYTRELGDSEPKYMMVWQGLSAFLVWLSLVSSRGYFLYRYGTSKLSYEIL